MSHWLTMPTKSAAATTTKPAQDPLDLEIQQIHQAIAETRESTDPAFIAKPQRRLQLLAELSARIDAIEAEKVRQAADVAERELRQQRQTAWVELAPQRVALAERWSNVRAEIRQLLADAQQLDALHLQRCDRRALSEGVMAMTVLRARAEVIDGSPVLLRPVSDF